jgi:hypothetical protein
MAGAKKEKQRAEKEQHKRNVAENEKQRNNNLLTKKANVIDLPTIRKELVLFYKFLEKFVAKLKDTDFVTAQEKEPEELRKIPFISPSVTAELESLDSMDDLAIYSSGLLQYAVHFDLNISPHTYTLNNNIDNLFIGRNDKMILTPDSVFNLAEMYSSEKSTNTKTTIVNYLKNMQKVTSRLNEQIDYDVINFILEKNKSNVDSAKCKYNESIKYYTNISLAKKALSKLANDKSGFIDDMVDTAAHEIKIAKESLTNNVDSDEDDSMTPEEYLKKNQAMLQTITSKMTNKIGNNIIDGKVNQSQFVNIANSVMSKIGKTGKLGNMKKLKQIDINKMKEIRDKCQGDFSKMFDMNEMFSSITKDLGGLGDITKNVNNGK